MPQKGSMPGVTVVVTIAPLGISVLRENIGGL
jgi:hypothetical protein